MYVGAGNFDMDPFETIPRNGHGTLSGNPHPFTGQLGVALTYVYPWYLAGVLGWDSWGL